MRGQFGVPTLPPTVSQPSQAVRTDVLPCTAQSARPSSYPALLPPHPTSTRQHYQSRVKESRRRPALRRFCIGRRWTARLLRLLRAATRQKGCPLSLRGDSAGNRQLMKKGGRAGRERAHQRAYLRGMLESPRDANLRTSKAEILRWCSGLLGSSEAGSRQQQRT